MKNTNSQKSTDDMEMPTPCQHCGNWFELNEGHESMKWYRNTTICAECSQLEEEEIGADQDRRDLLEKFCQAVFDVHSIVEQLDRSGIDVAYEDFAGIDDDLEFLAKNTKATIKIAEVLGNAIGYKLILRRVTNRKKK